MSDSKLVCNEHDVCEMVHEGGFGIITSIDTYGFNDKCSVSVKTILEFMKRYNISSEHITAVKNRDWI